MYKIVPVGQQKRSEKTVTKNRCKPSKKWLTTVVFGTPGWVRTSGLSLRRRPLYPTELRGLIQKIFNFAGLRDSNDSIFRRRSLYTAELRGHMRVPAWALGLLYSFWSPLSNEKRARRLSSAGPFPYWITRTRITLGRAFTSSMMDAST